LQVHESRWLLNRRARTPREISTQSYFSIVVTKLRRFVILKILQAIDNLSFRVPRGICLFRCAGCVIITLFYCAACATFSHASPGPQQRAAGPAQPGSSAALELSRPVRPWEFLCTVGTEAGLFGNESGNIEAWVYPLKILRDFHLRFHTDARVVDAASLARTITARPESVTILYTGDTYNVRETFFVPVNEQGAIIKLEIETEHPLDIEVQFQRDFQLEWPAALGGTYGYWDKPRDAFYIGEETKKFVALVGSPTATDEQAEYSTNYSSSDQSGFRLGVTQKGKETKRIVIAASVNGPAEAEKTYRHLLADSDALLKSSADYYRDYLAHTVSLELPDKQIQDAYDWSRISELQGVVKNPYLGTGIVAGYRTSGSSQRPGFAWFFGRDSMWTSLAFDAAGDFASTRIALDFLSKVQRADGKIPHEIAQGASFVDWFKDYPYGFASADATPLYIIAMEDYVRQSGDVAFAKEKWPQLQKAYDFLKSTYGPEGFPQNSGIGHGWVEGGPLLPVKTEFYQSGLGAEAIRALSDLAQVTGQADLSTTLRKEFEKQRELVYGAFWIQDKRRYAFALDSKGKPIDEPTVLAAVPAWFGSTTDTPAARMADQLNALASSEHATDWGMRIISNRSPYFSGGGYHFGSVWPLFTGWASVAEYRYNHDLAGYENLRANALLALDGSLGHVTEVLSGDYYQPLSTSSPHQIWSAAMVVSPVLKGMFGLERDAGKRTVSFRPHVPADWTTLRIHNLRVADADLDISYHRTTSEITLEITRTGGTCTFDYEPLLLNSSWDTRVDVNGRETDVDYLFDPMYEQLKIPIALREGKNTIRIRAHDFGVSYASHLPVLGSDSQDLRILSQVVGIRNSPMELMLAGRPGATYDLDIWNPAMVDSVDGGVLIEKTDSASAKLRVHFDGEPGGDYRRQRVMIYFHVPKPAKGRPVRLRE
jgi:glycogen debranching enzyme